MNEQAQNSLFGGWRISRYAVLPSTNAVATELAKAGEPSRRVIIADEQSAGKGQRGHGFFSPAGGLYMSVLLRITDGCNAENGGLNGADCTFLPRVTQAAAVAVCRAIEDFSGIPTGIKWVNDIIARGGKVCGILTQFCGGAVIIGIGVNLLPCSVPAELRGIYASVFTQSRIRDTDGVPSDAAEKLAKLILTELDSVIDSARDADYLAEYRARDTLFGKNIIFTTPDGTVLRGVAQGIDDSGGLVLLCDGERKIMLSGSASLVG